MSRKTDLKWFERNRDQLAKEHSFKWIVVFDQKIQEVFDDEADAILSALEAFGVNKASVFQATSEDPISYAG